MRIFLKKDEFNFAVLSTYPRLSLPQFCKKFQINYQYLSMLKSQNGKNEPDKGVGPFYVSKILDAFDGKFEFTDLFDVKKS